MVVKGAMRSKLAHLLLVLSRIWVLHMLCGEEPALQDVHGHVPPRILIHWDRTSKRLEKQLLKVHLDLQSRQQRARK